MTRKNIRKMLVDCLFSKTINVITLSVFISTLIPITLGLLLFSCNKLSDPSNELISGYTFSTVKPDQKGFAQEFLADSIGVLATDKRTSGFAMGLKVEFLISSGDGSITRTYDYTNSNGIASTHWKLGSKTNKQQITMNIYDPKGYLVNTLPIYAYGFSNNTWDTVFNSPEANMTDMITDTLHKITLITTYSSLYRQSSPYYNWILDASFSAAAYCIEMDHHGNYYIGSWNGDVYKSVNQGESWKKCTVPFPNYNGYVNLKVTPNNYVWVSTFQHSLLCSRDGGATWEADTVGFPNNERLGEIVQLKSGTFFLSTLNGNLYKSIDDGKTWIVDSNVNSVINLNVTNKDQILVSSFNSFDHLNMLSSSNEGKTYTNSYSVYANYWYGYRYNSIVPYKDDFLVLLQGKGIYKTKDFINFSIFWENNNIINLFKDANNVLIAKDNNMNRIYYRKEN
jgi:hypothetical protein